jgi:hypothetical protein
MKKFEDASLFLPYLIDYFDPLNRLKLLIIQPIFIFSNSFVLEVVSKLQIRFKSKAQADRESAAYMGR